MKLVKKLLAIVLAVTLVFGLSCFVINASAKQINFLVLGDSIAEGYGVENSGEAAYGKIVADTNGWNYKNYAHVTYDTKEFLDQINNQEEIRQAIKEADIINICTGSNNYLSNDNVVGITVGAIIGVNDSQLDSIAEDLYNDYEIIYSKIRTLNPDAVLIFNRIYCAWQGLGHIPFNKAVNRINAKLDLLASNHKDIILFDTDKVITHNTELIAEDCVHPNAAGNVALAKALLELMYDNGLCTKTDPVVLHAGIDYNFYVQKFGYIAGYIICGLVKMLTKNY